jgi:hypothetical protein
MLWADIPIQATPIARTTVNRLGILTKLVEKGHFFVSDTARMLPEG